MASELVGKWCHSYKDGEITYQGKILGLAKDDIYLIQLFSYADGGPTIQKLFKLEDMMDWTFYNTAEDMGTEWEKHFDKLQWLERQKETGKRFYTIGLNDAE